MDRYRLNGPWFSTSPTRSFTTLNGLTARERSLRNAASRTTTDKERARRTVLADEVKTEIEQALARGQVVAIRQRSRTAVSGFVAWLLYAVVIGGLMAFAIGTDKVSSDRDDPIADAKACGEARKAGATAWELGRTDICDRETDKAEEVSEPASAAEARTQITANIAGHAGGLHRARPEGGRREERPGERRGLRSVARGGVQDGSRCYSMTRAGHQSPRGAALLPLRGTGSTPVSTEPAAAHRAKRHSAQE